MSPILSLSGVDVDEDLESGFAESMDQQGTCILEIYRIEGNFGKVSNLANWRFCRKLPNLKPTNIISYTIALYGRARDRQI